MIKTQMKKYLYAKCQLNHNPLKHQSAKANRSNFRPILGMLPVLLACSPLMAASDGAFLLARTWNTGGTMLGSDTSFSLSGGLRRDSVSASYSAEARTDSFFKVLGFRAHVVEGNAAASFGLAMTPEDSVASADTTQIYMLNVGRVIEVIESVRKVAMNVPARELDLVLSRLKQKAAAGGEKDNAMQALGAMVSTAAITLEQLALAAGQAAGNSDLRGLFESYLQSMIRSRPELVGTSDLLAPYQSMQGLDLTSTGTADLNLRVMGLNIASFRRDFVRSDSQVLASFSTSPLIKEVTFAEQRFMVGPVPVKVAAGASIQMRGEGIVQRLVAGGAPGIETRMGPVFDAALVASGAVDAFVASAGVKAKASLAKAAMNAFVCLTGTLNRGSVDYGLDIGFMGTNGELSLFAKALLPGIEWRTIKIGFIRIRVPVPVLSWHEWSTVIAAFRSAWETTNLGRGTTWIW